MLIFLKIIPAITTHSRALYMINSTKINGEIGTCNQ